ncbi:MAG: FKBP-type peptidyl-prolyl cis-trans isomerase [Chryseolinea sp.]
MAQSKKELAAQVESLKKENEKLKADVAELKKPKVPALNDTIRKVSYALGTLMASNLKSQGGDSLKVDAIALGFKDVYAGDSLRIPQQDGVQLVQGYMQKVAYEKMEREKVANESFMANNKKAEGVMTTASGLQYKVVSSGKGKMPKASDNVTVHYTGRLIDGTVFDSSRDRDPATFKVDGVIDGWTEALQLMHEGDKWTIFIPSSLGYGEQGAGSQIPPYATLIFDVELIKVN